MRCSSERRRSAKFIILFALDSNKIGDPIHPYIISLKALFEQNTDSTQAAPMKKYMRDQFEYLGIKTPKNVVLQKEFFAEHGFPELSELDMVLRDLWSLPERE